MNPLRFLFQSNNKVGVRGEKSKRIAQLWAVIQQLDDLCPHTTLRGPWGTLYRWQGGPAWTAAQDKCLEASVVHQKLKHTCQTPAQLPPFSPELEAAVVFLGFAGHFFLRVTVTTNYHSNSLSKLPILVMLSAGSRNMHPFLIFYILGLLTASW